MKKTGKKISLCGMFISLLSAVVALQIATTARAAEFYDINTVNTLSITFSNSNWDELLDDFYTAGDAERLSGTAVLNGVSYEGVGVRYKGNSSYDANSLKNPLNIKLDYTIDDQTVDGYGTLKLANVRKDPSFVREVLGYEIARKYMPASNANFIDVYINGTHLGLYTSVQDVDKDFLKTHFGSKDNASFKGEVDNIFQTTAIWGYLDDNEETYYDFYELDSGEGWDDLIDFLYTFNNSPSLAENVLNVDSTLWMLAFDILTVNLDSPVNVGHNFYIYLDDSGRFNPVIWDLNEGFGSFSTLMSDTTDMVIGNERPPIDPVTGEEMVPIDPVTGEEVVPIDPVTGEELDPMLGDDMGGNPNMGSGGQLTTETMQELTPFLNADNENYPIIKNLLDNPTYKKIFVAHMKTIIDENFADGQYLTRARDIQAVIDAVDYSYVQADTNKFYTYTDFLNNIESTTISMAESIVGITELMDARISYLQSQTELLATQPTISDLIPLVDEISNSLLWFTATVEDATLVQLAYRESGAFSKVEMLDDGMHQDGNAGDGVYGISISFDLGNLEYYVYAENDAAAALLPVRAEYEFYSLSVELEPGDLVINEFMADNETTATDQDEEYEDWIELYNNSDTEIDLEGYYLTDDSDDITQWTFPAVTIAANGYLIIWADNDEDQDGLHTNFKLSASGETLILASPDETIVDQIEFDEQEADVSMARDPNGTGDFTAMSPTFEASNSPSESDDADDTTDSDDADDADDSDDTNDENGLNRPNHSGHSHTSNPGDIDGNSTVEFTDALLLLKILCGITPPSSVDGQLDIDGDGYLGASDVLYILNAIQEQEISQRNNQKQQVHNSPLMPQPAFVQTTPVRQEQTNRQHSTYQQNTGNELTPVNRK